MIWSSSAARDLAYWELRDPQKLARIRELLADIRLEGTKAFPIALRGDLDSFYSRRIDRVNRLVYSFTESGTLSILSCRYRSDSQ